MFNWSHIRDFISRKWKRVPEELPVEMCQEADRLGIPRAWLQSAIDQEGLKFARYFLSQRTNEAALFERWYPQVVDFVREQRLKAPLPPPETLSPFEAATYRILEPKIRQAEHIPVNGKFTATFFSAPLHVLPLVMQEWPATYQNAIFLTHAELRQWREIYEAAESDQDAWWFAFQDWDAEIDPAEDSLWLREADYSVPTGMTPVVVTWGLCWGSLAGGQRVELWGLTPDGHEQLLQLLGDETY